MAMGTWLERCLHLMNKPERFVRDMDGHLNMLLLETCNGDAQSAWDLGKELLHRAQAARTAASKASAGVASRKKMLSCLLSVHHLSHLFTGFEFAVFTILSNFFVEALILTQ